MEERVWKSREGLFLLAREMLEVVLGLGAVVVLGWWLPETWRLSHFVFCAFFVVVFAIAVRYHTSVAYSASSLAAVSYGLLLWLHPAMRVRPDFFSLTLEPFLLLVSGVLASDILRWQRHRLVLLEQKYADVDEACQTLQERYQEILTIKARLEQQIAGLPTSVATLSEKMAQVWKLAHDERFSAMVDLIVCAIEAQSCAFYARLPDSWQLCAEYSMDGSTHIAVLNADDPLIARVIEQRKVSTIRDALAEGKSVSPEGAVMAGPLLDQAGEIVGIVSVNSLPLLKFTPSTIRLFSSLLNILSFAWQTVGQAERVSVQQPAQALLDPDATEPFVYTPRAVYQLAIQAESDMRDPALPKLKNSVTGSV